MQQLIREVDATALDKPVASQQYACHAENNGSLALPGQTDGVPLKGGGLGCLRNCQPAFCVCTLQPPGRGRGAVRVREGQLFILGIAGVCHTGMSGCLALRTFGRLRSPLKGAWSRGRPGSNSGDRQMLLALVTKVGNTFDWVSALSPAVGWAKNNS